MEIAIITGGSRGLGKSMAEKGQDVILTYNSKKDEAQQVVAQIEAQGRKAVALQLDVSKSPTFGHIAQKVREALASTWGRDKFDLLVNNAGEVESLNPTGR